MNWKPYATLPEEKKDGRWMLLYHDDFITPGIMARWDPRGMWRDDLSRLLRRTPTHWIDPIRP